MHCSSLYSTVLPLGGLLACGGSSGYGRNGVAVFTVFGKARAWRTVFCKKGNFVRGPRCYVDLWFADDDEEKEEEEEEEEIEAAEVVFALTALFVLHAVFAK